jgi:acyl carrier protein
MRKGELFVTGRFKDLIVIRGRNYYPEDIEQTVEAAHPSFRSGHCLAFSIDDSDQERLVVVQELEPRVKTVDSEAVFRAVRKAIALTHGIEVHAIVLAKAGANPKTTSGKRRRSAGRKAFLNNQIESHAIWGAVPATPPAQTNRPSSHTERKHHTSSEIRNWLQQRISAQLHVPKDQVRGSIPFLELGMSSLDAMEVATDLQTWIGRQLSPTAIYNYPNVDSLSRWLSQETPEPVPAETAAAPTCDEIPTDLEDIRHDVLKLTEAEMEAFICQEMAKQQNASG